MHDDDNDPREDRIRENLCKAHNAFSDAADAIAEAEWNTAERAEKLLKAHASITLGWRALSQAEVDGYGDVPLDGERAGGA